MPGASKQRARMCRACECVGCALDATTPVTVGAITIVGVEVSGAAVVICVGVVVTVSSVTAGDRRFWILLPPYQILPGRTQPIPSNNSLPRPKLDSSAMLPCPTSSYPGLPSLPHPTPYFCVGVVGYSNQHRDSKVCMMLMHCFGQQCPQNT